MKKYFATITIVLALTLQIISCHKKPVIEPPVNQEGCQITEMTYTLYNGADTSTINTAKFKYNYLGNPVSVLVSNAGQENPNALFLYDKYNRLSDFIGTYDNVTDPARLPSEFLFEYWIKYDYKDENPSTMPGGFKMYYRSQYKDGQFYGNGWNEGNILYDSQGRITNGRRYDTNGNRILDFTYAGYDDKKGYKRTNKIWMFIDGDYSVNNSFTALKYNSDGLPLAFPAVQPPRPYLSEFLYRPMNILTMQYSCSASSAQ